MRIFTLSVLFSLLAGAASASGLSFDTRADTSDSFSSPLSFAQSIDALMVQAPGAGYGSTTLNRYDNVSNQTDFAGSASNVASRGVIDFNVAQRGTWEFRVTMDLGVAGAVFLDGAPLLAWNNAGGAAGTQTFTLWEGMTAGVHQLLVYDLEGCCDAPMQAEFLAPGRNWTVFALNDGLGAPSPSAILASNPVVPAPEPASTTVLAVGCLMLALSRRRRGAR